MARAMAGVAMGARACFAVFVVGLALALGSFASAQGTPPGADAGADAGAAPADAVGATPPTTVAPTTAAPTAVAPTTVAPTAVAPTTVAPTAVAPTTVALYLFWGDGCPHCASEKAFLATLQERYPALDVRAFEVYHDATNRGLMLAMAEAFGREASGVPMTFLGDYAWVGFGTQTADQITAVVQDGSRYQLPDAAKRLPPEARAALEERMSAASGAAAGVAEAGTAGPATAGSTAGASAEGSDGASAAASASSTGAAPASTEIRLPIVGVVDVAGGSLLVGTFLIALADGFNPCSLWVLALLLAVVVNSRSRRRVVLVGLVFLTVAAIAYATFIAGLYTVFSYVGFLTWVRVAVAAIAVVVGAINLKDYFAYKHGPSLTIDDAAKPGIFRGIRNVMSARASLAATVLATGSLALGVTLIELPCTAGLPVLWTNVVADAGVGRGVFGALLLVYMLVFLIDEMILFGAAVVTMRAARVDEREGRVLKLVGGAVMLALALAMLAWPDLLDTVTGMLLVFGAALVGAGLVLVVHRVVHPASSPLVRPVRGGPAGRA